MIKVSYTSAGFYVMGKEVLGNKTATKIMGCNHYSCLDRYMSIKGPELHLGSFISPVVALRGREGITL